MASLCSQLLTGEVKCNEQGVAHDSLAMFHERAVTSHDDVDLSDVTGRSRRRSRDDAAAGAAALGQRTRVYIDYEEYEAPLEEDTTGDENNATTGVAGGDDEASVTLSPNFDPFVPLSTGGVEDPFSVYAGSKSAERASWPKCQPLSEDQARALVTFVRQWPHMWRDAFTTEQPATASTPCADGVKCRKIVKKMAELTRELVIARNSFAFYFFALVIVAVLLFVLVFYVTGLLSSNHTGPRRPNPLGQAAASLFGSCMKAAPTEASPESTRDDYASIPLTEFGRETKKGESNDSKNSQGARGNLSQDKESSSSIYNTEGKKSPPRGKRKGASSLV